MSKIVSIDPATGKTLSEIDTTNPETLPKIFEKARLAQQNWAALSPRRRVKILLQLRETILHRADALTNFISQETGKPRFEVLCQEILPAVELISFLCKRAPKFLRDKTVHRFCLRTRTSRIAYSPLGTVLICSTEHLPFFLPLTDIIPALITGNAVLFKPQQIASSIGHKIQELFEESGLPPDIFQTFFGPESLTEAAISHRPAKLYFSGTPSTAKNILSITSANLLPVTLHFRTKNPMLVLADSNLEYASSAATWGAFHNSGQDCSAIGRIIVHESIAKEFEELLAKKAASLHPGDLTVLQSESQRTELRERLEKLRTAGARFICGGDFVEDGKNIKPAVIANVPDNLLREDLPGPAVYITTFRSLADAVRQANDITHALTASVFSKTFATAEEVARQLNVSAIHINDAPHPNGRMDSPWTAPRNRSAGPHLSAATLQDFTHVRKIDTPKSHLFLWKSPRWFPYLEYQHGMFRKYLDLFHRHWTDKARAFPLFLWNLVQYIKREPRL